MPAKDRYHIVTLPGDGIGPEVTAEAVRVLEAAAPDLEATEAPIGLGAFEAHGAPLPPDTLGLVERTGLSETVVGFFMTSIATSLPELVTSLAAVRQGALTLAVGGIIGGNTFDVLFLSFSDMGYRAGSIYHAISEQQLFIIALAILMTGILLLGLLRREKRGIASIGFESFLVLIVYAAAFSILI